MRQWKKEMLIILPIIWLMTFMVFISPWSALGGAVGATLVVIGNIILRQ